MFRRLRRRLRRLKNPFWILLIGGLIGVGCWDGMLLLVNISIALWGGSGDLMIRTQYGDLKAWWLVYVIMTVVGFGAGALYVTDSLPPSYKSQPNSG